MRGEKYVVMMQIDTRTDVRRKSYTSIKQAQMQNMYTTVEEERRGANETSQSLKASVNLYLCKWSDRVGDLMCSVEFLYALEPRHDFGHLRPVFGLTVGLIAGAGFRGTSRACAGERPSSG